MATITNSDNPLITVIISQKIEVLVNCTEFLLWQTLSNCFRMFLMFFLLSIRFCDISLKQEIQKDGRQTFLSLPKIQIH